MDTRLLLKTDLNLLLSFQVLLEERSVSKAAERLFITQPAMSKTLTRLRRVFDDPLFTRSGHGMQPTPRAEAIARELPHLLGGISHLLEQERFDPLTHQGELTVALSEYIGVALMPRLMQQLHERAPLLTVKTITRVDNQLEKLRNADLDFAVHLEHADYGDEFQVDSIARNDLAVLARAEHPLVGQRVDWSRLSDYPAIRLYISDLNLAEATQNLEVFTRLRAAGAARFETSHLLTALEVLRGSDYVMPAPSYLLRNPSAHQGIVQLQMPARHTPSLHYVLVSHRRSANSALHRWFAHQLLEATRTLDGAAQQSVA